MHKVIHGSNLSLSDRRKKRVKRIKVIILIVVMALLILPSICSMILFAKINYLQEKIEAMQIEVDSLEESNELESKELESKELKSSQMDPNLMEESYEDESKEIQDVQDIQVQASNQVEKKQVYLTFDDGPSSGSNQILDILAKYNIKATFFVVGKTDDDSKKVYNRIVQEGHTLGMHSYSHVYSSIYSSTKEFEKDVTKLQELLQDVTGISPKIYRFPGGSSNRIINGRISEFVRYLNKESIIYYDWNVSNGDALGTDLSQKELISNVIDGVDKHTKSIVLMHDAASKQNTVKSLSDLIEALLKKNVEFFPIDQTVKPIQHKTIK